MEYQVSLAVETLEGLAYVVGNAAEHLRWVGKDATHTRDGRLVGNLLQMYALIPLDGGCYQPANPNRWPATALDAASGARASGSEDRTRLQRAR